MTRRTAAILAWTVAVAVPAALSARPGASDIEKFHRVDARVSTAAQPTLPQIAELPAEGYRTVINLREPSEHDADAEVRAAKAAGLRYVSIPVRTADPKTEQVDAFLKALSDPAVFPVLLHCGSGNRVGAFWMIRRVLVDGWTSEDAEREAREIGMKSPNLKEFAAEYIRQHPRAKP